MPKYAKAYFVSIFMSFKDFWDPTYAPLNPLHVHVHLQKYLPLDKSRSYSVHWINTVVKETGGGLGGLNPPWILDGGVEHLSTPLILRKKFFGGVGSP